MNTYTLKITLQSDTLVGAAGGHGGLIDSEVVFDEYGIPYIPGKRIKGLLRDSLMEVSDLLSKSNNSAIDSETIKLIFGKQGSEHFSEFFVDEDLHLDGYENLMHKMANGKLLPETVKSYFATELSQTAMDEETGSAKEGSLRRIRILKASLPDGKNLEFQAKIRFPGQFENHIALACKNLTRMGTIRNRGLGNISTNLYNEANEALTIKKSKDLFDLIKLNETGQSETIKEGKNPINTTFTETKEKTHYLEINLQNIQKLLIPANGSDENMVSSLDYIQGSNILGLMAQKYLEKYTLDESFFKLFLRGYLSFSPALPVGVSDSIQTVPFFPLKTNKENNYLSYDAKNKYKGKNEYLSITEENKLVLTRAKTQLSLHHERNKKTGMVDETLYNYQAISPYQQFRTRIFGNKENLEIIKGLIKNNELVKIGASQTAEYGSCKISASEIKKFESSCFIDTKPEKKEVVLCLVSDTIIYNSFGYPSLNVEDIKSYLTLQDGNSISPGRGIKNLRIENYIKVWKSKKPSDIAFKAGSCFELNSLPKNYEQLLTEGLGERTHEGYGKVFFFYTDSNFEIVEEKRTQNSNEKSDTFNNLSTWVKDKDLKKEIELLAMEYAEGFADKNMGSFARQLIKPILQVQDLADKDSIQKALSRTARDKINSFDNKEGKSLFRFFEETELVFKNPAIDKPFLSKLKEAISEINQGDKKAELKKHFIRTFLTYLNLANKSTAS